MGIYYVQREMHIQLKALKKRSKIDIYKQDFGWLTYIHTHTNIHVHPEVQQIVFLFNPKSLYQIKKKSS